MHTATLNTIISAPHEKVFDLVSDVERLPEWAVEFAPRLVTDGSRRKVVNAQGEFYVEFETDRSTGVVDMLVGKDWAALGRLPTRVVEIAPGQTLYSFTLVGSPDMPDEAFEASRASLARELVGLKRRLEAA